MAETIVLYDIPGRYNGEDDPRSWSFNPWKSRMVLNYKRISYKTHWLEFPDIDAALKATGVSPNEPGTSSAPYSCPAVRLADGTVVMNSINIAHKLEQVQPDPSLRLNITPHEDVKRAIEAVVHKIWWGTLPQFVEKVLLPRSGAHFRQTREKSFGATLEELAEQRGGEKAWQAAEAPGAALESLRDELTKHKRDVGPFILGSEPSYADFVVASVFECWKRSSQVCGHGNYDRLIGFDPVFGKLHDACSIWLEKDD